MDSKNFTSSLPLITGSLDILSYFQFSKSYELIKHLDFCLIEAHLYDFPYIFQCPIYRFAVRMTTPEQRATYYLMLRTKFLQFSKT